MPNLETDIETEGTTSNNKTEEKTLKPPPIFVYGVKNLKDMETKLGEILEKEHYVTKTLADSTIKINTTTSEAFRALAKFMNDKNIVHHTYQPKENRAYRVVIKYLHHSIDTNDIKEELNTRGHTVRNIMNIKHRQTKESLNMFFVDLEPAKNNKEIYQIKVIQNRIFEIEPPRKENMMPTVWTYEGILQPAVLMC